MQMRVRCSDMQSMEHYNVTYELIRRPMTSDLHLPKFNGKTKKKKVAAAAAVLSSLRTRRCELQANQKRPTERGF